MQIRKLVASTAVYLFIYFFGQSTNVSDKICTSSTMQKVIGPILIYSGTFFFFIFSWPHYVLPMPKFKP